MDVGTFRHIPESLTNSLGMKLAGKSDVILKAKWDPTLLKFIALNLFLVVKKVPTGKNIEEYREKYRE